MTFYFNNLASAVIVRRKQLFCVTFQTRSQKRKIITFKDIFFFKKKIILKISRIWQCYKRKKESPENNNTIKSGLSEKRQDYIHLTSLMSWRLFQRPCYIPGKQRENTNFAFDVVKPTVWILSRGANIENKKNKILQITCTEKTKCKETMMSYLDIVDGVFETLHLLCQ